jgi:glyoxylase-like metal-dependent hydrolase (beta-lactamase superfamily II)
MTEINTIDLNFQGIQKTIASYAIPHENGVILIESGPGSTIPELGKGLKNLGFSFNDITDILLTHIHLDHAGAAGWLARKGAKIHVHEVGAPHMLKPERLLISATRIYGDLMEQLWGKFIPVPEENLITLAGDGEIEIQNLRFNFLETPGHASHHLSYIFEGTCFSGDVGGVRLPGPPFLRLPTPPPEFHIEKWNESVNKLIEADITRIAPTHFGIFEDATWHLKKLQRTLVDIERWIEDTLPNTRNNEKLKEQFSNWELARCKMAGLDDFALHAYSLAMPLEMGADGIWRYWDKFRNKG